MFLRYLRLFEVFNRSGKYLLWNSSSQGNICRAFFWSGKCPSGMCLDGEVSVGEKSVGIMSVEDLTKSTSFTKLKRNFMQNS